MTELSIARRGGAMVVTLDRPPVNALSRAALAALGEAVEQAATAADVKVLHIRSTGRSFCAGADLAEMREAFSGPDKVDAQIAYVRGLQQVFQRIEDLPVVSIAEIGGHALGGGFELALACDLRIGAHDIRLGLPEVNLGLIPGAGGTQRLTRLCGPALAKRLILGAEVVDGATAAELGLLHWAVPAAELPGQAQAVADRIAALPRAALAGAKACIAAAAGADGFEMELAETRRLMGNAETQGRVGEFLARGR